MRLRTDVSTPRTCVLAAALLLSTGSWVETQASVRAQPQPPTTQEIARALDAVKDDPNLAPVRTMRMLRWRKSNTPRRSSRPGWLSWIVDFFRWIDQSARVLVWGLALTLGAVLVAYLIRLFRNRSAEIVVVDVATVPVRVRDLDIRPESLPADIGDAAKQLWDRGEHRAALALLYRGMLSRFVHVHQVPVRDSTTEADCLMLAARHLETTTAEYATRLVSIWQRAVYGREEIETFDVYRLCDGFRPALDRAALSPSGGAA